MNFLKPLNTPIKKALLWGFDIETYGKDNKFLMGSIVGDLNIRKIFWDKEEFLSYLKNKSYKIFSKGYICASNLQFDILSLLYNSSLFSDFYPIVRNSQFIFVKIPIDDRRNLKFIDTFSFCNFSVEKWGDLLKYPKLEKPSFLGNKPSDYWQKKELEDYNLRDSEITYKAITYLQNSFNNLGCKLKITISSSALDLYRRTAQKEVYFQPKRNLLKYLYNGYYGGRTEIIKRGSISNLKYYDYNSLYPSVMVNEYPYPNDFKYSKHIKLSTINDYEGLCRVKIKSPKMFIPYLPYRIEKPTPKLIFPYGEFTGYYTFFELRKAIELGYEIKKFYNGLIYFKKFYPFREYINKLYSIRKEQKANDNPMEMTTKFIMNSTYGKFAQKIEEKDEIIHESKVTMDMIENNEYVERNGEFFTFKRKNFRIPSFINPIFSIYTTAYARDKLYNAILKCKDNIFYYDTDSIMTKKYFETSSDIGELKLEFKINDGILIKPKMYMVNDIVKCKGLGRMNKNDLYDIIKNKKRKMTRFSKFKESNRRHLNYNTIMDYEKIIDLEDNKRKWFKKFNAFELQESVAICI